MTVGELSLVARLEVLLADWIFFHEVIEACADKPYRELLGAWSDVRERHDLLRDDQGRYKHQSVDN